MRTSLRSLYIEEIGNPWRLPQKKEEIHREALRRGKTLSQGLKGSKGLKQKYMWKNKTRCQKQPLVNWE